MIYERYPDELVHYGVKGMKWGIIRSRSKEISDSYDNISKRKRKRKSIKKARIDSANMTDAELRARVNRMQMEKQYADLLNSDMTRTGRVHVNDILSYASDVIGIAGSTAMMIYGIKALKNKKSGGSSLK